MSSKFRASVGWHSAAVDVTNSGGGRERKRTPACDPTRVDSVNARKVAPHFLDRMLRGSHGPTTQRKDQAIDSEDDHDTNRTDKNGPRSETRELPGPE